MMISILTGVPISTTGRMARLTIRRHFAISGRSRTAEDPQRNNLARAFVRLTNCKSFVPKGRQHMTEPDMSADAVAAPRTADAVLTVMRLVRTLERVDSGLTPQQYRILKMAGAGGERSARLAERLAVAKPTLTATADGLVAAGYAQREAEAGDRRVVRLCLTAAGRAALERADAAYADWLGPLLGATGDMAGVLEVIRGLDTAMDERRRTRIGVA